MRANLLALNDDKTEVVWFSSKFQKDGCVFAEKLAGGVQVGGFSIKPSSSVRDLGVMVDSAGTMDCHLRSVCSTASHSLWKIGKIRKFLDRNSTEKLIHAFVTSKLDYCNSLFFGLNDKQIHKLQKIQNSLLD